MNKKGGGVHLRIQHAHTHRRRLRLPQKRVGEGGVASKRRECLLSVSIASDSSLSLSAPLLSYASDVHLILSQISVNLIYCMNVAE